ncbi:hypothetical protein TVAG_465450 [Trichomonas vaginalis G3]|uniref:BTB domain-containing protein n=1 Tax=Trichomonas vaginalis (strain ATCC PRA-98 / G3) TaxID=412133 RepID=A2DU10_TRIV3|nr:protein ubiquitination [Trichomonas vaginalis G3]EAY16157.1 hypothetical protein TVAG_465450 [Trichomonas vaginalis G3]KAI5510409.1 protein ubiquitination [Trichomonas vaginalis G3]|eukprot:XP_001328380.1 hypothetical protein [Trichomonas vaginalis G3]
MVRIQLNNQILQRINNYQSLDKITLTINNVEISVTKSFAVAISQNFYSQYLLDNNIAKIDIQTDIKLHETYNVLKNILQYNKTEIECDETVLKDLFNIGMSLDIQELTYLYKAHIIDQMKLDKDNCVKLLEFYSDISSNEKITECINFISSHFYEINTDQLKSISKKHGIDIFQKIFSNQELVVKDEDSLANFIISLLQESTDFYTLVENIHFELCSEKTINDFKCLANENNFQNIVNSFADSLIRSRNPNSKDRSINAFETVSNYFGSENVEMTASSYANEFHGVINKYRNDAWFETNNSPNSWVQWKIKQDYAIQPTEYNVRTAPDYRELRGRLQTWKVEGTTINGDTKVIHEVNNSPLKQGEIRKYEIKTNDEFISFKLTQTGKNDSNGDWLLLDVFDFSGKIHSLKK